jgi:hypothetical protein
MEAIVFMSRCEVLSGNPQQAIERINQASRHNPFGKYNWSLVPAYYVMRRYDEAKLAMRAIQSPAAMMIIWMAAVYAQAGDTTQARELATRFVEMAKDKLNQVGTPLPQSWLVFVAERWPFKQPDDREHFLDGLRKAGVPG